MKHFNYRFLALIFIIFASCGGPDALVINTVNRDGSVDRKIILTWDKDEFNLEECQVPVDSTWSIGKVMEISEKGDTTWTLTAEKHFDSVTEINLDYTSYGGPNSKMKRKTEFLKRFRWFNTTYYFEEKIEKAIDGYPASDFFTKEELHFFYMPQSMVEELGSGSDSTMVDSILNIIEEKQDAWLGASLVKAAIDEVEYFNQFEKTNPVDIELIRSREKVFTEAISDFEGNETEMIDSIMGEGYYEKYKTVFDTSLSVMEDKFQVAVDADSYLVQCIMPGSLIATNGYIDSNSNILWNVDGESFVSEDYIMWAESTLKNRWAYIVSILFVAFVATGFVIRKLKRRGY
ncbi:MAG: hypothetical protein E4G95_08915 [Bacteroidia bacterium]|nr:MAG: hypothetical protein E4G95_08915 [Bacteroidia bacterium]